MLCSSSDCNVYNSSVVANSAQLGGGLFIMFSGATLSLRGSFVALNSDGVGAYLAYSVSLRESSVVGNNDFALSTLATGAELHSVVIKDNVADAAVEIVSAPSPVALTNSFVAGNVGDGILCAAATIEVSTTAVCDSGVYDVRCNFGCTVTDSTGDVGCDNNGTSCYDQCNGMDNYCVPTSGYHFG